jgi:Membrane carboxypeptidase/penicillin-binding protein
VKYLNGFGINTDDGNVNATIALGNTSSTDFTDIIGGYAALAAGGEYIKPSIIAEIYDSDGKLVYLRDEKKTRVISTENAYIVTDVLTDTARTGTARGLSSLTFEVASKTGTVGNERGNTDAYNVAYTSDKTFLVWHGNSTGDTTYDLDLSETGGAYATRTMRELLTKTYENGAPKPFTIPDGIEYIDIDAYALAEKQELLLSNVHTLPSYIKTEIFSSSNRPTEISPYFLDFTVNNVSVSIKEGKAYIDFLRESYLCYDVYRVANGKSTFLKKVKENEELPLIDFNIPYNAYVKYSIKPYFFDQFGKKIEGKAIETDTLYANFDFNYYNSL